MSTSEAKILVVDDDESICKLCANSLKGAGFNVETTCDPYEAFQKAENDSFDLVLTDIRMPQMSGIELMQKLRGHNPELVVIIMTGFATLEVAINAAKEGAYNFIRKPFKVNEIVLAVKKAIERRHLVQENIRLKTLVNLFQVSEKIGTTLDAPSLFNLVLEAALKETGADTGVIFYPNGEREQIYILPPHGLEDVKREWVCQEIVRNSFEKDSPICVTDISLPGSDFSQGDELGKNSVLAIPIQNKSKIMGVLSLYKADQTAFTEADKDVATILASQAGVALHNVELISDLEALFLETMKSLATTVDERDPSTHGHSQRVAALAVSIGQALGLSDKELDELEWAGILHDIGKIGIRDEILFKPGPLTAEEYEIIKTHAEKGYNILKHIHRLSSVVEAVYSHHEWYNGQGYPRGLAGEEIPLWGAILAVADAFDTLTTDRPYQAKRNFEEAMAELRQFSGIQFHPRVVTAMEKAELTLRPSRLA